MKINQPKYPIQYPIYNKPHDKMEPLDDNDYGHSLHSGLPHSNN